MDSYSLIPIPSTTYSSKNKENLLVDYSNQRDLTLEPKALTLTLVFVPSAGIYCPCPLFQALVILATDEEDIPTLMELTTECTLHDDHSFDSFKFLVKDFVLPGLI